MQVFKVYFKVLRVSAAVICIYLAAFIALSVLGTLASPQSAATEFDKTKTRVAIINRDGDAPLAQGLADYLGDIFTVVPYDDDPEKLQDGIFYHDVEYVAIIPQGFSAAFMAAGPTGGPGLVADSHQKAVIQKVIVPASMGSHYVDLRIDEFLNAASIHRDLSGAGEEEGTARDLQARLVATIRSDLAAEVPVTLRSAGGRADAAKGSTSKYPAYFAYLGYALVAMVMLGISSTMIAFNRRDLRLRNVCTPVPQREFDLWITAGHAVFALGCWAIMVLFVLILNGTGPLFSGHGWLYLVNSLVLTAVTAAIGSAVGHFVKTSSGQSGAVNIISLGMSFLCGVFVPQSVMNPSVLAAAKFLPVYWYIRANDGIAALASSASGSLYPIYGFMLVQVGFALAILSVTLLFSKERRLAEL